MLVRKDYRRQAAEHARNAAELAPALRDGLDAGPHAVKVKVTVSGGSGGALGRGSGGSVGDLPGSGGRAARPSDDPSEPLLPQSGPAAGGAGGGSWFGSTAATWGAEEDPKSRKES